MKNTRINPARPETYPRRILLAVTGLSPQIVTETLYALAVERKPAFLPTEIHVISTAEGAKRVRLELLHRSTGHFKALCREYGLKGIHFDEDCIHTIKGLNGKALEDIQTNQDNTLAADAITELVRDLSKDEEDTALHVSIAGGRKTMGFYLGYALSLYGRGQDRLSHVLVNPRFENNKNFFYPPKGSDVIHNEDNDPLDTEEAKIILAEIPFVRMRHGLPKTLQSGKATFSAVVGAAQENLGPPSLRINSNDKHILCAGKRVKLSPQQLAFYAWIAEETKNSTDGKGAVRVATHSPARFIELYDIIGQNKRSNISKRFAWATKGIEPDFDQREEWQKEFEQMLSRINSKLDEQLGYAAQHYRIQGFGTYGRMLYSLTLNTNQIELEEFD